MNQPEFNMLIPVEYRDRDGKKKTQWVRFGSLWLNRDGKGYSGTVDFFPTGAGNRVVLMPPKADASSEPALEAAE